MCGSTATASVAMHYLADNAWKAGRLAHRRQKAGQEYSSAARSCGGYDVAVRPRWPSQPATVVIAVQRARTGRAHSACLQRKSAAAHHASARVVARNRRRVASTAASPTAQGVELLGSPAGRRRYGRRSLRAAICRSAARSHPTPRGENACNRPHTQVGHPGFVLDGDETTPLARPDAAGSSTIWRSRAGARPADGRGSAAVTSPSRAKPVLWQRHGASG